MAENKTQPTDASVEDFIASIENATRQADTRIALQLYQDVTGLEPVMWGPSIIGFGQRPYEYDSGRTGIMPAAGFSPRKANMTFYIGYSTPEMESLLGRLGKHKKSVACLYVNKLADIDLDVLREIVAADFATA